VGRLEVANMKLGVANSIAVFDVDLSATQDVRPTYTDCVVLLSAEDKSCNDLGQEWLACISEEV
jgi:hypothetical protein